MTKNSIDTEGASTVKGKKPKLWHHSSIVKEIKKLIKLGHDVDAIVRIMCKLIDDEHMNHSVLTVLIEDTVEDYPNYDLIQKIVRSKLIINMDEKADKYYIVDPKSTDVSTVNAANAKAMFLKPDFSDRTYMASFQYNPYELNKLYKSGDVWRFNTYEPPEWLVNHFYYGEPVKVLNTLPNCYEKFLMHLTDGDSSSFNYILDWLASALRKRNYCILSTIGNQGIGKGVLGSIMELLVGSSNYSLTDNRLITKEFNSQILNKRIVYIDELKVANAKEENRLKLLINDKVEVEGKGVDSVNVDNYASIYVSSNDFDAIRLRGDDRRFSIVKLTDNKLLEVMSDSEIKSLLSSANVAALGRYLWHRKVDFGSMNKVFVSERTAEVRESSLKGWEEWFIEQYCFENKGTEVALTEVSEAVEDLFGSRTKPSRRAFNKLREVYPDHFKMVRKRVKKGDKEFRIWYVCFT